MPSRTKNIKSISGAIEFLLPDGSRKRFADANLALEFFDLNYSKGYDMALNYLSLELPEVVDTALSPLKQSTNTKRGVDLWIGANHSPRFERAYNLLGMNPLNWPKHIPASYWDSDTHKNVLWGNNVAAALPIAATAPAWLPYLSAGTLLPEAASTFGAGANALAGWTAAGEAIDGGMVLLGGYDGGRRLRETMENVRKNGRWTLKDTGNTLLGVAETIPIASKLFPSSSTRLTISGVWNHAKLLGVDIKHLGDKGYVYSLNDPNYLYLTQAFVNNPSSIALKPTLLSRDLHAGADWIENNISRRLGLGLNRFITNHSRSDQVAQGLELVPEYLRLQEIANELSNKRNKLYHLVSKFKYKLRSSPDSYRLTPINLLKAKPEDIYKYYRKNVVGYGPNRTYKDAESIPIPFTVENGQLLYLGKYPMDPYLPFSNPVYTPLTIRVPLYGTGQFAEGTFAGYGGSFYLSDGTPMSLINRRLLPESIRDAINHNLSFVEQHLPGSRPFGSSVISRQTGWAKAPNDIDVYMTQGLIEGLNPSLLREKIPGETYSYDIGAATGRNYTSGTTSNEWNGIDINVLRPTQGGTEANSRALELYQQYFPEEYTQWKLAHPEEELKVIPHSPEELIAKIDPSKSTTDMLQIDFSDSAKNKHMDRLYDYVINSDNSERMSLLLRQSLLSERGLLPPTYKFNVLEDNEAFLEAINFPEHLRDLVKDDPYKMLAVADLWFADNTTHFRGISGWLNSPLGSLTKASEAFGGGKANGAGINTVLNGDSGRGPIRALILPYIPESELSTPLSMVEAVNKYEGRSAFTPELILILLKHGFSATTPKSLAYETSGMQDTLELAERMAQLGQDLGINAYSNNQTYNSGIFSAIIRDLNPGEYSITMPPLRGRRSFLNRLNAFAHPPEKAYSFKYVPSRREPPSSGFSFDERTSRMRRSINDRLDKALLDLSDISNQFVGYSDKLTRIARNRDNIIYNIRGFGKPLGIIGAVGGLGFGGIKLYDALLEKESEEDKK